MREVRSASRLKIAGKKMANITFTPLRKRRAEPADAGSQVGPPARVCISHLISAPQLRNKINAPASAHNS
jgi:hypothetical protein